MTDATTDFFEELGQRGHEPLLNQATGNLRVHLRDGKRTDRWLVAVKKGDIAVSRSAGPADCNVRAERALFNRVASGEANFLAALLRGEMSVEGKVELLVRFQRLFPGPPSSRDQQPATGKARRQP